ncbi:MAG: hypothetical protein BGN88_03710 [Clostridiales bacterium 43-6]|nr:MAG: hypothetical protein BGN88_03710 [Clostridiales bacterium 43-6]
MENALKEACFDFISDDNKRFITAFTNALKEIGFLSQEIGNGFCWGRYMIIYRKQGAKSKTVYARIYIRDDSICLRLFFNNVTKHAEFIINTPEFIRDVFMGDYGKCKHCKGDHCKFRKDYEINGVKYEKCNGVTFEFYNPSIEKLPHYMDLFQEFYCKKSKIATV